MSRCNLMENDVQVRVIFKGKMAEKFKAIKDQLGVENNTEVLRILLNREYEKLPPEAKEDSP